MWTVYERVQACLERAVRSSQSSGEESSTRHKIWFELESSPSRLYRLYRLYRATSARGGMRDISAESWRAVLVTGACLIGWVGGVSCAWLWSEWHNGRARAGQPGQPGPSGPSGQPTAIASTEQSKAQSMSIASPTIASLIGNTPLVHLKALSARTGCTVLAKAEFLNPGGSIKDRVALQIIEDSLESGALRTGGLITEGTVGSTGVSLAMLAPSYGCRAFIAMPDDAAEEKSMILQALGAEVARVRPVSISHPDHFVHVARRRAASATSASATSASASASASATSATSATSAGVESTSKASASAVFANQFENLANRKAHLRTGQEIVEQVAAMGWGKIDAFVCGCGTGGTMAGVGRVLKEADRAVRLVVADPPGSGLFNKITRGVMYTSEEAEGKRLRNPFDTITEGVGINRLTANFETIVGAVDDAVRVSDVESVEMSRYLLREEGLFVGSSSAVNVCGAAKVAQRLGPGHVVVTILCDGGARHLSKFWSAEYVERHLGSSSVK